jgi:hypothetical protein
MAADGGASWIDRTVDLIGSLFGIGQESRVPWWAWAVLVLMLLLGFVPSGRDEQQPGDGLRSK